MLSQTQCQKRASLCSTVPYLDWDYESQSIFVVSHRAKCEERYSPQLMVNRGHIFMRAADAIVHHDERCVT